MYLILEHTFDEDEMEGFKSGTINDVGKRRHGRPAGFRGPVVLGLCLGCVDAICGQIRYLRSLSVKSHPPSSRRPHPPSPLPLSLSPATLPQNAGTRAFDG